MWSVGVVSGCGQWVWLIGVSGWRVDLKVEGVRYIEIRARPASFKGRRSRTRGQSQCVLVKIWRSTWNSYFVWCLNVVVR